MLRHTDSGLSTGLYGHGNDQAAIQLSSMELDELLSRFLDQIDYDAMSDFFLAYRPYVKPVDLFVKLSTIYLQAQHSGTSITAHYTRVRTFVALRHWILNYFPDDFLLSLHLQKIVEQFLQCLGGIGVDEISTEARIAKELRRSWDRESKLHRQLQPYEKACKHPLHKTLLRDRHVTLAFLQAKSEGLDSPTVARTTKPTQAPISADERSQMINIRLASGHHDSPNALTSEADLEMRDFEKTSSFTSPRRLRRRPGGILKNVRTVAEVVANNRSSTISTDSTARNFRRLNAAFSLRPIPRSTLSLQKQFTQDLARMFESDHCDESQEDPATLLSRTMDKLEGRVSEADEDQMSIMCSERLLPITPRPLSRSTEGDLFTSGSRKRKRHAGCLLADASPTKFTTFGSATQSHNSIIAHSMSVANSRRTEAFEQDQDEIENEYATPSKRILSSQSFTSDTEVSIIDALGIPPLPRSMLQNTMPVNQRYRPRHVSWIMNHNTAHLSNCLLAIEQAAFGELDWLELTSAAWEDHLTDHVQDWHEVMDMEWHSVALILARSNLTTLWVISEIVQTTDMIDRARVLTKFIDIAQLCRDHNNLATVVQIVSALQSAVVNRLKETWQAVSQDTIKTWTRLSTLCDSRSRYKMLRSVQDRVLLNPDASLVPCLAPYLEIIKVANTSSSTITEKMTSVAKTTKVLMNMFDRILVNEEDLDHGLLDKLVWIRGVSEEQAFALSKVCEA